MNFREHFEAWHEKRYGYKSKYTGTALHITYDQRLMQARWEAWQACASWHTGLENQARLQQHEDTTK